MMQSKFAQSNERGVRVAFKFPDGLRTDYTFSLTAYIKVSPCMALTVFFAAFCLQNNIQIQMLTSILMLLLLGNVSVCVEQDATTI